MSRRPLLGFLLLSTLASTSSRAQAVPPGEYAGGRAVSRPVLRPLKVYNPAIASNGSGFFAAWNDGRYGNPDEFGARITPSGELVDAEPATIVATWKWDSPGAVVRGDGEYVVFTKTEMGSGFLNRVRDDGTVLGAGTIDGLTPLAGAWNGSRYAVVCAATRETPLQLQFFGSGLERLERVSVGESGNGSVNASVAAGNGRFLVAWEDARLTSNVTRVLGQLFDDHGNGLTQTFEIGRVVATTFDPYNTGPAVSWNGTGYVVVHTEPGALRYAVVTPDGVLATGFTVGSPIHPQPLPGSAAISWDGQTHLIVWIAGGAYQAITVDPAGGVHQSFTLPIPAGASTRAAVASNGEMFLVVAGDRRVAVQPNALERARDLGPITYAYLAQSDPVISAGSSDLLTAWFEGPDVYASRVAPNGLRTGDELHLGHGPNYGSAKSLTAASAGDRHLVAWRNLDQGRAHVVIIDGSSNVKEITDAPVTASSPLNAAGSPAGFGLLWTKPSTPNAYLSADLVLGLFDAESYRRSVLVGTSVYGVAVDSITWTDDAYAILWRANLNAPCISSRCSIDYDRHLTRVALDGTIVSDVILPKSNFIAATADARGALVISYVMVTSNAAQVVAQRFAYDGTASPAVLAFDYTLSGTNGKLLQTPWGYTLVRSVYVSELASWHPAFEQLDPEGRLIDRVVSDAAYVNDAASAFGTVWAAYTAPWIPLPGSHQGMVYRAFYRSLVMRTRAIRR